MISMREAFFDESDDLITNWLDHNEELDRHIFTKVAGVSFQNRDGSFRQTILSRKPLDRLVLRRELDNPVSKTAVSVLLETGEQIGYLIRDSAKTPVSAWKKASAGSASWFGLSDATGTAWARRS